MLVGEDRPGALDREQRIGRVVEAPVPGQLDRPLGAVRQDMAIRVDIVHQRGIVEKAVLLQELEQPRADLAGGRAIAFRNHPDRPLQRFEALLHLLDLGGRIIAHPAMRIAVMADLVAALEDHLDPVGMVLGSPARHEERALEPRLLQRIEDLRHADLGAVAALAQHAGPVGIVRIARGPQRLGVEIEGQHDGAAGAVRPGHAHIVHRKLLPEMVVRYASGGVWRAAV